MYHTGGADTRSVRSLMQFMMSPLNGPSAFHKAEADFKDIRAYLLSIEAAEVPAGDRPRSWPRRARRCSRTTAPAATAPTARSGRTPTRSSPLKEIGTDPRRYEGITKKFGEYYDKSWFAGDYKALASDGYQAPPLDGVWATAPYLHNGSVPTLYRRAQLEGAAEAVHAVVTGRTGRITTRRTSAGR